MGRRELRRDWGRSLFVWLMIAVPLMLITTANILLSSQDISPAEWLDLRLGTAEARLTWHGTACDPGFDAYRHATCSDDAADPPRPIPGWGDSITVKQAAVAKLLGQPVTAITFTEAAFGPDADSVTVLGIDPGQHNAGILRLTGGRQPNSPAEVLVTPAGAAAGMPTSGTLALTGADGSTLTRTVVGTAAVHTDGMVELVGLPDAAAGELEFLVTGTRPITWEDARGLAQYGLETTSRAIAAAPPSDSQVGGQSLALGGLIGGGALLEVALMIGPAFAIGAARQRRSLALAATNGATAAQLRRVALGQAWLLGLSASPVGIALGVAVGAVAWPQLSSSPTEFHGPFEIPWTYLAVMLGVGVLVAVVAALLPARGLGRLDLVGVLRGSTGSRPARRTPLAIGLVLLVAGLAGSWGAAPLDGVKSELVFIVWLAATVVAVAGLLLCVPALLSGIGRVVGRTPAAFRMAVREISRQRGRATATVAAIVGGTLLIGVTWTLMTSIEADQAREWVAARPLGQAEVNTESGSLASIQAAAAVVHGVDPSLRTAPLASVDSWSPDGSADHALPIAALRSGCTAEDAEVGTEDRCLSLGGTSSGMLAGSVDDLAWLFRLDTTQRDALAKGQLLVNTDRSGIVGDPVNEIVDGHLELAYLDYAAGSGPARTVRVPALGVTGELITRGASVQRVGALVAAETAAERGWLPRDWSLRVVDPAGPIGAEAADRINAALAGHDADLRVERGFEPAPSDSIWVLTGTLALLAVVAAAMATILGTAELRPFLATFAAVGADPRLSRRLAAIQSGLTALLGTVLGLGLGVALAVPLALTYTADERHPDPVLALPWTVLAAMTVMVPLVAASIAAVSTPARPVLTRRTT
jgi:putative ABC transport system permease protein